MSCPLCGVANGLAGVICPLFRLPLLEEEARECRLIEVMLGVEEPFLSLSLPAIGLSRESSSGCLTPVM